MSEDWIQKARRLRIAEKLPSREIAKRFGVSRDQAREAIADIVLTKTPPAWHLKAIELHNIGLSPSAIGRQIGKSTGGVHGALTRKGITPNKARDGDIPDPERQPVDAQDMLRAQCRVANDAFLADLRRYHGDR